MTDADRTVVCARDEALCRMKPLQVDATDCLYVRVLSSLGSYAHVRG